MKNKMNKKDRKFRNWKRSYNQNIYPQSYLDEIKEEKINKKRDNKN